MRSNLLVPLVLLLSLAACGTGPSPSRSNMSRTTTGGGGGSTTSFAPDAAVATTAPGLLACPGAYAELRGSCDPTLSRQACSYPEGSCYCGVDVPCSGAEIDPAIIAAQPATWQCTATPPAIRGDGCPGAGQSDRMPCAAEGKVCSWGSCCFTQMTCKGGAWTTTGGGCPP